MRDGCERSRVRSVRLLSRRDGGHVGARASAHGRGSTIRKYVTHDVIDGDAGNWVHKRKDGTTFAVHIRYHAIQYNES